MQSRRQFLGALSGALASTAAGCSGALDSQSPSDASSDGQTTRGEGYWREESPLPFPQSDAGGGVVDGRLYYFGGFKTGRGLETVARTYAFDPAPEEYAWKRVEDVPRTLWGSCGVSTGERVFSFGGCPGSPWSEGVLASDGIFVYDPDDGWTDLTASTGVCCPYRNWAMRGVYDPDDGLVYLVGGRTHRNDREALPLSAEARVWTFDPESEAVADAHLAEMPEPKWWPSVARVEVDGRRYVHAMCGLNGDPTRSNYRYDVEADEWERMAPAPVPAMYATNSDPVVDNVVYLTHGRSWRRRENRDNYRPYCHSYDPVADAWTTDALARPRHLRGKAVDAVIDGRLYVVGGHVKRYDQDGLHECLPYHESFAPPG